MAGKKRQKNPSSSASSKKKMKALSRKVDDEELHANWKCRTGSKVRCEAKSKIQLRPEGDGRGRKPLNKSSKGRNAYKARGHERMPKQVGGSQDNAKTLLKLKRKSRPLLKKLQKGTERLRISDKGLRKQRELGTTTEERRVGIYEGVPDSD